MHTSVDYMKEKDEISTVVINNFALDFYIFYVTIDVINHLRG